MQRTEHQHDVHKPEERALLDPPSTFLRGGHARRQVHGERGSRGAEEDLREEPQASSGSHYGVDGRQTLQCRERG